MANAAALKILQGFEDGTIRHTALVTDVQMKKIVDRFAEQYEAPNGFIKECWMIAYTIDNLCPR